MAIFCYRIFVASALSAAYYYVIYPASFKFIIDWSFYASLVIQPAYSIWTLVGRFKALRVSFIVNIYDRVSVDEIKRDRVIAALNNEEDFDTRECINIMISVYSIYNIK